MAPRKKDQDMRARTLGVAGETIVGLFADQLDAERGIQALRAAAPGVSVCDEAVS